MSGGRFDYQDMRLRGEMFGYDYDECGFVVKHRRVADVLEDRQISDLAYDLLGLIHDYDWYASGDTGEDEYLTAKAAFKKKWFGEQSERTKRTIDEAIDEFREELYKTFDVEVGANEDH